MSGPAIVFLDRSIQLLDVLLLHFEQLAKFGDRRLFGGDAFFGERPREVLQAPVNVFALALFLRKHIHQILALRRA